MGNAVAPSTTARMILEFLQEEENTRKCSVMHPDILVLRTELLSKRVRHSSFHVDVHLEKTQNRIRQLGIECCSTNRAIEHATPKQ